MSSPDNVNREAELIARNTYLESRNFNLEKFVEIALKKGANTRRQNKQKEFKPKQHYYVKFYKTVNQRAIRAMFFSPSEMRLLFSIMPFINYMDNMIVKEDKTPMIMTDIEHLCGWKKTQNSIVINGLVEKGVLEKIDVGNSTHIRVTTKYFQCGNF